MLLFSHSPGVRLACLFCLSWEKQQKTAKDSKRHQKTAKDTERQRALSHRGDHLDPPLAQNWRKEASKRGK